MDHRPAGTLSAPRYFLPLASLWLLLLWFVATRFPEGPFWQALMALLLLGLPLTRHRLAQSRIEPDSRPLEVVQRQPLDELQLLRAPEGLLNFQNRLLVSGGSAAAAGVLTAVAAGKLTAKILTKSSFKLAAKALGKVAASKTAGASVGAGAGAATGAAIGSVVPGLGTVIGAAIGGIVGGIAVGVGLDMVLIEIEEELERATFRAELLAAIDEARAEFLATPP